MVKENIFAFVSVTNNAQQSHYLVDVAKAVNLLHVMACTHIANLYQGLVHAESPLMPLIYADFTHISLNNLLYNYFISENFKWRRTMIVYEPSYGKITFSNSLINC